MQSISAQSVVAMLKKELATARAITGAVTKRSDYKGQVIDSRTAWTNGIVNALARAGKALRFDVYPTRLYYSRDQRGQGHNSKQDRPRRPDDAGEYMVDYHLQVTFEDFLKLVDIKSSVKLFVGTTSGKPMSTAIVETCRALALSSGHARGNEEYAVLLWGADDVWDGKHRPEIATFTA